MSFAAWKKSSSSPATNYLTLVSNHRQPGKSAKLRRGQIGKSVKLRMGQISKITYKEATVFVLAWLQMDNLKVPCSKGLSIQNPKSKIRALVASLLIF
jgi:hypothetical protein